MSLEAVVDYEKISPQFIDSRGYEYDYYSIMHYSPFQGNNKYNAIAIEPLDEYVDIGQREGLSDGDIDQTNEMYKCDGETSWFISSHDFMDIIFPGGKWKVFFIFYLKETVIYNTSYNYLQELKQIASLQRWAFSWTSLSDRWTFLASSFYAGPQKSARSGETTNTMLKNVHIIIFTFILYILL